MVIGSNITPCASSFESHIEDSVCNNILSYITPAVRQIVRLCRVSVNVQKLEHIMIVILKIHLEVIRLTRIPTNERSALIEAGGFEPAWEDEPAYNWEIVEADLSWAVPASLDLLGDWLWNGSKFTG